MPRFENGITQFVCVVLANNNNTSYEFLFSSFFRTSWLLTNTFFHARTSSTIIGNVQKRTNSLAHAILNLFTDLDTRSGSTKLTITGRIHSLSNWENVFKLWEFLVFFFFWRIFLIYNQELLFCLSSRNMVMISIQKCFGVLFCLFFFRWWEWMSLRFLNIPRVSNVESIHRWHEKKCSRSQKYSGQMANHAIRMKHVYTCTLYAYLKYRHFSERACNCSRRTATATLNHPPATVN